MARFFYTGMDLFADACRGVPLFTVQPDNGIAFRVHTGAVGQMYCCTIDHTLFLERKEVVVTLGHRDASLWWYWCLGFQGRLSAEPPDVNIIWCGLRTNFKKIFWSGLAHSPPHAGLPRDCAKNLVIYGLVPVFKRTYGLINHIAGCNYFNEKMWHTSSYTHLADIGMRPHAWLAYIDLDFLADIPSSCIRDLDEFRLKYQYLTLKNLCGKPVGVHGDLQAPGRLLLIQARLARGETFDYYTYSYRLV